MHLSTLKSTTASDLDIDVSKHKVYRAKRKALEMIEGNEEEQYEKMRDYCSLILRSNPGSIVKLQTEPTGVKNERRFMRVFICYDAMKTGFKEGCRPLISVDGCFLKGPYGGHFLSAVANDGNGQMFPVAIAVVESEIRDSWEWFMGELMDAIGPYQDITFISDRQKGLVETFENMMEGSDHRFCVRHLYENFKLRFKGQQLKIELWEAARAYTEANVEQHMRKIRDLNVEAYEWLRKVPAILWSMSGFTQTSKCDMVINNICESWNVVIVDARDKPIIYMLEWIRRHLMLRFQCKREWMSLQQGLLCPEIQKNLNKVKHQARICKVHYASDQKYEVECYGISEAVDIEKKSYSCRVWNLTGIPYRHAVACTFMKREAPEVYVHLYYHRETYLKSYAGLILPSPMGRLMKIDPIQPLLLPHYRKPTGRPKKARNKKNDEPKGGAKLSRSKENLKCSRCKENGHNIRICKAPEPLVIDKPPPRRGGRPPILGRGRPRVPEGMTGRGRGRMGRKGRARGIEIPPPVPSNQEWFLSLQVAIGCCFVAAMAHADFLVTVYANGIGEL
ncbi:uncharacterized protein LOC132301040 [Cornus florida]|uniref:uncharacterized protein LOC132301040 n=1 Tax=Cornus florida TaxID=4283 RepID=UPI00289D7BCC|nr:uncharacterized protein LOC132301040 [Cornus florida]